MLNPAPCRLCSPPPLSLVGVGPQWLLTSFDCSTFWVKERKWLSAALSLTPPYLRSAVHDAGLVMDFRCVLLVGCGVLLLLLLLSCMCCACRVCYG